MSLVTAVELAKALGVSRSHVHQMVKRNEIPAYHVSGCLRFDMNEVLAHLGVGPRFLLVLTDESKAKMQKKRS